MRSVADDLSRLAEELHLAPAKAPRTAEWLKEWEFLAAQYGQAPETFEAHPRVESVHTRRHVIVALTICSRNFGDRGGPYFMVSLTLAGIVYLLAIREFFASPIFSRRVVVMGLVLAAVWHVEFLRLPSGADDDIHRYVWDGRLQRLGYNPYLVVPSDPAVRGCILRNPKLE